MRRRVQARRRLRPPADASSGALRLRPPPAAVRPEPLRPAGTAARYPTEPAPVRRESRTSEDWEALIGGNWVNKIGVFVAVIGLALLLKYAYIATRPRRAGRAQPGRRSLAMLVAGVVFERRERYRTFSYGLIGGGWAALYTTVYAMHAIPAAKVLERASPRPRAAARRRRRHDRPLAEVPLADRHRPGLFLAFVTLAIAEVTTFSVARADPAGRFAALRRASQ